MVATSASALTLAGNAIARGLPDRNLARTAVKAQQTPEPRDPAAPVNLWEPADGTGGTDYGAHGVFDTRAHDTTRNCGPPSTTACWPVSPPPPPPSPARRPPSPARRPVPDPEPQSARIKTATASRMPTAIDGAGPSGPARHGHDIR
jgi:hypothetical protein